MTKPQKRFILYKEDLKAIGNVCCSNKWWLADLHAGDMVHAIVTTLAFVTLQFLHLDKFIKLRYT